MKYADINKRYTEIVTEYMSKGYTINTATMSGSQGETAKIDLTNGTEIIRIKIESFASYDDYDTQGIEIIVGRATDNITPNNNDSFSETIWNNRLEIISTERFYEIARHGIDLYGTKEEAQRAAEIRSNRWSNHRPSTQTKFKSQKAIEIGKNIIRNRFGYTRINESELEVTKNIRRNGEIAYTVSYRNNVYRLR